MIKQNITTAVTSMTINGSRNDFWKKVEFYEHVNKKPNLFLRLSLPTPQEVEGRHDKVGDTCRCKYSDGGYLTKRITRIIDNHRIEFEVIEQSIRYQNTIKLLGGIIEIQETGENKCIINMTTYFDSQVSFSSFANLFIRRGIKAMHRFVIRDMKMQLTRMSQTALAA